MMIGTDIVINFDEIPGQRVKLKKSGQVAILRWNGTTWEILDTLKDEEVLPSLGSIVDGLESLDT